MRPKINKTFYILTLAILAGAGWANADSLNGAGGWQSWSSASLVADRTASNIGTPYWNNVSGDGAKDNVGWCLTGLGNCVMAAGTQGALSYYGNASASVPGMYFTSTGSPITISLQTVMTTQTTVPGGYDVVGYYLAGLAGAAPSTSSLVPLFDSRASTPGATATISSLTAGENYGFYIENIQGLGTPFTTDYFYLMDSTSNLATGSLPADSLQHFAAFNAGNGTYFLGDVDADSCQGNYTPNNSPCVSNSQFDYNDMMLEVATSASSSPEPASVALIGGGLLAVGLVVRRKNSRRGEK